jgi:hypothetical protein
MAHSWWRGGDLTNQDRASARQFGAFFPQGIFDLVKVAASAELFCLLQNMDSCTPLTQRTQA